MNAQFIYDGNSVDFVPKSAVSADDIVARGGLVGVAKLDIEAGTQGALSLSGVYKMVKAPEKFVTGESVFWNAQTNLATHTLANNQYLGKAVAYAGETAPPTVGKLDKTPEPPPEVDAGEPILILPLTDNTGGTATATINSVLFDTFDRQTANSYASFTAKINEIIAVLERKGLVKTRE